MELFELNVFKYNLFIDGSMFLSIFTSFFSGFFADKIGFRVSLIIGTILLTIMQSIVTFGIYTQSFWIVFIGKTGLGATS